VLEQARELIDRLAAARKQEKEATDRLNRQLYMRYGQLSDGEVASLVVDRKWIASLRSHLEGLVNDEADRLAARIVRLETRYESTLRDLERAVESAGARVDGHLAAMGVASG
jgi:type I restriction enzyme M protein